MKSPCLIAPGWVYRLTLLALPALISCNRGDLSDGNEIQLAPVGPVGPPPKPPCSPPAATRTRINEVMVLNESTLADEDGKFSPWVEIYNPSDAEFDLGGTPLSDDFADNQKWKIPCIAEAIVPSKGFLIIFLDGSTDPNKLHANFTISNDREDAILVLNRGGQLFRWDSTQSAPDVSVGRFPDGSGPIDTLSEPTPGAPNKDFGSPATEANFVRGDANGDGRVTISDVALITKVATGELTAPPCQDRLDANDDGAITADDALYVRDALFNRGPPIPPPYPEPGPDPTEDSLKCPEETE